MVPSHNLDCRPGSAVDLYFHRGNCADSIFKALVVSLSQHAELVIPCPVEPVKIRLPPCQLGHVNRASSQRISQPVASKTSRGGSEVLPQGKELWLPGTAGVKLQTGQLVFLQCRCALESPAAAGLLRNLLTPCDAAHRSSSLTLQTDTPLQLGLSHKCIHLQERGVGRKALVVTLMVFQHMYTQITLLLI